MQPHAGRHIRRTFKHYLEDRSPCYSTLTSSLFPTNFECHHWLVRQGNEMGGKKKRKEGGREGRGGGGGRDLVGAVHGREKRPQRRGWIIILAYTTETIRRRLRRHFRLSIPTSPSYPLACVDAWPKAGRCNHDKMSPVVTRRRAMLAVIIRKL